MVGFFRVGGEMVIEKRFGKCLKASRYGYCFFANPLNKVIAAMFLSEIQFRWIFVFFSGISLCYVQ